MTNATSQVTTWLPALLRSIVFLVVGLFVTFSSNHEALIGFISLGAIGVVGGAAIIWEATSLSDNRDRRLAVLNGLISIVFGSILLISLHQSVSSLLLFGGIFAATTGLTELIRGLLTRSKNSKSRDWITVGALTCLLAVVLVLLPANFSQPWTSSGQHDSATGVLDAQVVSVGLIGAWAVLCGVFLVIAAFSYKWSSSRKADNELKTEGDSSERTNS